MAFLHPWYNRAFWRKHLRVFILQRDPVCKMCERAASVHCDHIIPFCGENGEGENWVLFSDVNNLQGLCANCHSIKTATCDAGFGHKKQTFNPGAPVPTGTPGRQWQSSSVGSEALDRALGTPEELKALVEEIP